MIFFIILIGVILLGFAIYALNPQRGGNVNKSYKSILENSLNHTGKVFKNSVPTEMAAPKWATMKEFFRKGINRIPDQPISSVVFNSDTFNELKSTDDVKFSWFGHSSILLKMEGKNLLIDPVFSERVSMFTWMGPKRFKYENQMTTEALPHIDAVLISHDHYDHLDYQVILDLKDKVSCFYVPMGVRVHLEKWGVDPEKITDLDWWDEVEISEDLKIAFTPSRHFTGRGLTNRMSTLWGGWAFLGKNKRVYFSGDSGYFGGFKEIGEKFGPFDLAFIECGQYNKDWEAIHMLPEQSVQAATDVNAKIVVPVHWGKFKLSLHEWTEPVEMFLEKAKNHDFKILTPKPNEMISIANDLKPNYWWR
jgi:L-ascorbate metabolism protein UlaG (beta-lactamase superfamily)